MTIPIKNKLLEDELFRIKRMKEVIKTTDPHGHKDYLEIIYLHEGAGTHHIDHQAFEVNPFALYMILPGQIHSWDLTAIPKGFVIMLQKDFLLNQPFYDYLFQAFPVTFKSGYALEHVNETITDIFTNIENEFNRKEENYHAVIQTYLQLLFNLIKRETKTEEINPLPEQLKQFFSALEANFKTDHEIGFYANQLHITSKTLNNICKKTLGRSAGEIITEKLNIEAKKLLLYSDQTLSEIAYGLGFSDPSHFNKFFKRQIGVMPAIYRKGIS
ncbi:AraC family transcriptional regulator [Dyadobacter sp. CY326]|uniref:helix-turn-helix domain-containing protein n=1 Tax=Dyadobacter sp. CY326 TaxID=2907300 RepID=UPI001F17A1A9|nr:helix-turn-helix transcriptional regulator [Dyadobacter sp. CY326]MCE7064557.1 helix-turn-helix transcriptional regulator [Dyadobacter sp. CY326]